MLIGLSWHIVRMDDTRTVKKVLEGKPRRGRKKKDSLDYGGWMMLNQI